MSSKFRERRIRTARHAADLAAEVRREEAQGTTPVADIERWRRKQDEPARKHHANGILALRCYIEACGYAGEIAFNILSVAVAAAGGADFEVTRPDWLMGLYLRGGTPAEAARLNALPPRDNERRTLAKAWKRAFDELQAEQERTGIVSVRRRHGEMKAGKRVASKLHVLCAQDLAEIEKSNLRRGRHRLEGFMLAARAQVEIVRMDRTRFAQPTPKLERKQSTHTDPASRRPADEVCPGCRAGGISLCDHQAPAPVPVVNVERPEVARSQNALSFVDDVAALAAARLRVEVARGASHEEVDGLRAELHARIEELFADLTPPEERADLSTSSKEKSGVQNGPSDSGRAAESDAPLSAVATQKGQQNDDSEEIWVDKSVHPNRPPDTPDEEAFREDIARLFDSNVIDDESAKVFEGLAHDPATRAAFYKRYCGVSDA